MARLSGKEGAVYKKTGSDYFPVFDIFDWSFSINTEVIECSSKTDASECFYPSHGAGIRFTAKRRSQGQSVFPGFVIDAANNATVSEWRLDLIDNNGGFTQIFIVGIATLSTTSSPRDAVEET